MQHAFAPPHGAQLKFQCTVFSQSAERVGREKVKLVEAWVQACTDFAPASHEQGCCSDEPG